ncbi:MAG: hypothetical protein JNK82_06515 [Myxococcaceae bacterium]|nr:hypothetical protein [Myxococcaceae bacterium]
MLRLKSLSLVAAALLAGGCIHGMDEVKLTTSTEGIPAAQGNVRTMGAPNDNVRVIVKVKHLAPADRVASGATTYVVWAQPTGSDKVQNLGALSVDKKLNGSLMTVLPYESFKVFITAEPGANITEPTGDMLMTAMVDGR